MNQAMEILAGTLMTMMTQLHELDADDKKSISVRVAEDINLVCCSDL